MDTFILFLQPIHTFEYIKTKQKLFFVFCSPQRFTVKININSSSPGHNVPELEGEVEFYFHDSRCLYLYSAVYFLLLQLRFDDRVILKVMDIRKSDFQDLQFKSSSKSFHLFLYSKFLFLNLWWALLHIFP